MTVYGYARVSTEEQSLLLQSDMLTQAGAEVIYGERLTGTKMSGREELAKCLAAVRAGDTLMVTRLDRLARSVGDLAMIVSGLVERRVEFRCLLQSGVDTTTTTGRLMIHMLGAFAEFESDLRRERSMEGIRRAQIAGKYVRPAHLATMALARQIRLEEKLSAVQIANRLEISVRSVYRMTRGLWGEPVALKVVA